MLVLLHAVKIWESLASKFIFFTSIQIFCDAREDENNNDGDDDDVDDVDDDGVTRIEFFV